MGKQQHDSRTFPRAQRAREAPDVLRTRRRPGQRLHDDAERERVQAVFLEAFARTANVTAAARTAGIHRSRVYEWQERDATFSVRYHEAEVEALDVIRAAIHKRAVVGWDEPLISMGKIVVDPEGKPVTIHRYDSSLLAKLAAARLPEFRERHHVEVTGKDGGPVDVTTARETLLARLNALAQAHRTTPHQ